MSNFTSWIDVNLDAISYNIQALKEFIGKAKLLAVVKGNAYGHGMIPVAMCAEENGAEYLGVSTIEEGILLRQRGIKIPILLLNTILPEAAESVIEYDLTTTICSFDVVQAINEAAEKYNKKAKVHLKIDSGFGRFGILPEYALEFVKIVDENFKNVFIEGIFTHFSNASNESYTRKQFGVFNSVVLNLEQNGFNIPIKHAANSLATLKYPDMHLDMVRIGNALYGLSSNKHVLTKKAATIFSQIIYLKNLPKGHNVGYGNKFRAKKPIKVAVIPFGYYDGLELVVSQPGGILDGIKYLFRQILSLFGYVSAQRKVRINGTLCNIIGKIGMQNCMVDVTKLRDNVFVGDKVELNARKVNLNYSLPRRYIKQNQYFTEIILQDATEKQLGHAESQRGESYIG